MRTSHSFYVNDVTEQQQRQPGWEQIEIWMTQASERLHFIAITGCIQSQSVASV